MCTHIYIGLSHGNIAEILIDYIDQWSTKVSVKHTHLVSSISYCIMKLKDTRDHSTGNSSNELNSLVNSGKLKIWVEIVRSHIILLSGARQLEAGKQSLQIIAGEINAMKTYVDKMTIK